MIEAREPVRLVADVIREAVTCERTECRPEDHTKFVSENLRIAAAQINREPSQ